MHDSDKIVLMQGVMKVGWNEMDLLRDEDIGGSRGDVFAHEQPPAPFDASEDLRLTNNKGWELPTVAAVRTAAPGRVIRRLLENGKFVIPFGAGTNALNCGAVDGDGRTRIPDYYGVQLKTPAIPCVRETSAADTALGDLDSGSIIVDRTARTLRCGAGLTTEHVDTAIKEYFGAGSYQPVRLTTWKEAQLGATVGSKGQGFSRISLDQIVEYIVVERGRGAEKITDRKEISAIAGTWGLAGSVLEVGFKPFERPRYEWGVVLTLANTGAALCEGENRDWPTQMGRLQAALDPYLRVSFDDGSVTSAAESRSPSEARIVADGLEDYSRANLELMVGPGARFTERDMQTRANRLLKLLDQTKSDIAVCFTGFTSFDNPADFFDPEQNPLLPVLGKLDTEGVVHFDLCDDSLPVFFRGMQGKECSPSLIPSFRHALADTARQHATHRGSEVASLWSQSTDTNCRIRPEMAARLSEEQKAGCYAAIQIPYAEFRARNAVIAQEVLNDGIRCTQLVYGHESAMDVNPHNRQTVEELKGAAPGAFKRAVDRRKASAVQLGRDIAAINKERQVYLIEGPEPAVMSLLPAGRADEDFFARCTPLLEARSGEKGKMTPESWNLLSPTERDATLDAMARTTPQLQLHMPKFVQPLVEERRRVLGIKF